MEVFSFFEQSVFGNSHPKEDYFLFSKKYPIFAIADGVSLRFDDEKEYPKQSGAGEVAKIFCEVVVGEAEKRFDNFQEHDLEEIFKLANKAVKDYNISKNLTEDAINYWDIDLFSATTALAVIKEEKLFWFTLCDCGVVVLENNKKVFQSPNGWMYFPKEWKEGSDKEKVIKRHRDYRNAVDGDKLIGYGVANGQENAIKYLKTGVAKLEKGNTVLIYTDGVENYIDIEEFVNIMSSWPKNIEQKIKGLVNKKSSEDSSKYGREKTLIAVRV